MTEYTRGNHTVFYNHFHIAWITKYRHKALTNKIKLRTKEIIHQVAYEMGIVIENGIISSDHLHLLASIPPHISVSEFVQKAKGRSSRKIQLEFPELKAIFWGRHFWGRGYFCATSGDITIKTINDYINNHSEARSRSANPNTQPNKNINNSN